MTWKLPASHHRAKATIRACVESGAGIDFLPDAPTFRYAPLAEKPLYHGKPSHRGSVKVRCSARNCACKGSLWYRHEPLSAGAYEVLNLTDTSFEEMDAKGQWKSGNPVPLRELLAARKQQPAIEFKEAA